MLLSLAEIRALFETDLEDAALQQLLDAAEEEIVTHAGAHDSASDVFSCPESASVFLKRKAQSITSVTERRTERSDEVDLSANDYRLFGARELKRSIDGDNPASWWGEEVTVTYAPIDDSATRKRIQADLVKLAAQYNATKSESSGDLQQTFTDYQAERDSLLSQLAGGLALA